jgi:hypothetical protein
MPHRYDASTKYLLEVRLADWLPLSGRKTKARVRIVNADVSTVTAAADRVLLIEDTFPWIAHFELQAGRDLLLPDRSQMYNAVIGWKQRVPVLSVIVLLRPAADGPELTGVLERRFLDEPPYLVFKYQVVRIWEIPAATCLSGGLAGVISRMQERFERETSAEEAATLWTATDVLMGLRYPKDFVSQLLRGVQNMKESVTYQAIVEEGVEKGIEKGMLVEARRTLLELGAERFGEPDEELERVISQIADLEHLHRLVRRILRVSNWQELLAST